MAKKKAATKKAAKTKKSTKAAKAEPAAEEAKPKAVKKKATKRKSRAKAAEVIRLKLFWGVFNHAMKRVALYDFNQRKAAEKRAKELSPEGKPPHFVQKVKEEVVEDKEPKTVDPDAAPKKKKAAKKKTAKS